MNFETIASYIIPSIITGFLCVITTLLFDRLSLFSKGRQKREIKNKSPNVYYRFYQSNKTKSNISENTKCFNLKLHRTNKDENREISYTAEFKQINLQDEDLASKYVLTIINKSNLIIEMTYFFKNNKPISLANFEYSALKPNEGISILIPDLELPEKITMYIENATVTYNLCETTSCVIQPQIDLKTKLK